MRGPTSLAPRGFWRRHFPHPVWSGLLGLAWLLLSHSLALVHLLTALCLGWLLPRVLAPFLAHQAPLRWAGAGRLLGVVLWDIVVSNLTVARLVLGPMSVLRPAWVRVPLASQHERVNALFASIITTTPGTVSATLDEARGVVWVHALNCSDAQAMAHDMKQRYERPLLALFAVEPSAEPGLRSRS